LAATSEGRVGAEATWACSDACEIARVQVAERDGRDQSPAQRFRSKHSPHVRIGAESTRHLAKMILGFSSQ
jgi:hypothetical protein